MGRIYIIIAIIMLFALQPANADPIVRMRNDGKVVDIHGNIIAVPNLSDPRNTPFEKYYTSILPTGAASVTSDFYIIADPDAGFIRKDINPIAGQPQDIANSSGGGNSTSANPASANPTQLAENTRPFKAKSGLMLEYDPSMPIYDNLEDLGVVYGD